ncbi:MAG: hypothetical protein ABI867_33790 [Kofleriaceae bacterium]
MRFALLVVAACGSVPPKPPPPPPPASEPTPAPTSCGDAGVILRGSVTDARRAGPAKEAVIASACLHDRWPAPVLACIGGRTPAGCTDQLSASQRAHLGNDLRAWAGQYSETVDEEFDLQPALAVDCATGIGDVAAYPPALTVSGEDLAFAVALRRTTLEALCSEGWADDVKQCFTGGKPNCLDKLRPHERRAVTDKLAELAVVTAKIVAAKQQPPASYDCAHVALAYYSDAAWKGKAEIKPAKPADAKRIAAERAKLVADSRLKMTGACTNDAWSGAVRACVVGGGGDLCLPVPEAWGFPPGGVLPNTGIVECDAYGAVITRMLSCQGLPQGGRDAIKQSFEQQRQVWLAARPDQRATMGAGCAQAEQAMRQAAASAGCTI